MSYTCSAATPSPWHIDDTGISFVQREEGFSPVPYKDSSNKWTVATGHVILPTDHLHYPVVGEQAKELLAKDIIASEQALDRMVKIMLEPHEVDPLLSLIFNCGGNAIGKSTLVRVLNTRDKLSAGYHFADWRYAGGKPILLKRRLDERDMFLGLSE